MRAPLARKKAKELALGAVIHLRPGPEPRVILRSLEAWHRDQVPRVIYFVRHRDDLVCQLTVNRGLTVSGIKSNVFKQLVSLFIHSKDNGLASISITTNSSQARHDGP